MTSILLKFKLKFLRTKILTVLCSLLLSSFTSCSRPICDEVICETYLHPYGVPLRSQDWSERGENGQVVTAKRDGVVVTKNYENGILNGDVTTSFPHRTTIANRKTYKNGCLTQEIDYYPCGLPHRQICYEENRAVMTSWFESGAPNSKEIYEEGQLVEGQYLDINQEVDSRVVAKCGERMIRDEQGRLLSKDEIYDGEITCRRTYYPNGALESVIPYVNGVVQGKKWIYEPGGEPAAVEMWENNVQHGNTLLFENGEKVGDQPYFYGKKHGVEKKYRDGMELAEENQWVEGVKHGACHSYYGQKSRTQWYYKGQCVNRSTYEALSTQL